jgi:hypothetical protein
MYVLLKYTSKNSISHKYILHKNMSRFNYFNLIKHSICKLDLGASARCLADSSSNGTDYVKPHIMKFKNSINVQYMFKWCDDGLSNQVFDF